MSTVDLLEKIHSEWLSKVSHSLVTVDELREDFEKTLEQLYCSLKSAIQNNDPSLLVPILDDWVNVRTQTEFDNNREPSLVPIFGLVFNLTLQISEDKLSSKEALELMSCLLPIFIYCFEYIARKEMEINIDHISHDLEKANLVLKRLDKSKSDFISIAAHEFKTPLTLIEGYASMLKEQLSISETPADIKIFLNGINNGMVRLQEIVDDMIDVSVIDNNLLTLNFQPMWLNYLINLIRDEFSEIVKNRNLHLVIDQFPGYNEIMFGDNERIFQALRNVISNAIKYTPDGGDVIIAGRKLPGFIEITISDSGIGIDPEDHSRIFEKFSQTGKISLHSSGKTKFKGGGPGLGLAITKGIIETHGGTIWVESPGYNEDKCPGSTFHILLPERKEPPDNRAAKLFTQLIRCKEEEETKEKPYDKIS